MANIQYRISNVKTDWDTHVDSFEEWSAHPDVPSNEPISHMINAVGGLIDCGDRLFTIVDEQNDRIDEQNDRINGLQDCVATLTQDVETLTQTNAKAFVFSNYRDHVVALRRRICNIIYHQYLSTSERDECDAFKIKNRGPGSANWIWIEENAPHLVIEACKKVGLKPVHFTQAMAFYDKSCEAFHVDALYTDPKEALYNLQNNKVQIPPILQRYEVPLKASLQTLIRLNQTFGTT